MGTTRFFNATTEGNTLTLTLYDEIGGDIFGNGVTPQMLAEALNTDCANVTLRINSPGGDAFAGVSMFNLLRASSKPINVVVDGMAASAASIVAMAGDTIVMSKGAVMMIHEAQGIAVGDRAEMLKMADRLVTVTGSIADIYVARTKNSKKNVLEMMAEETWMDSKEAVANGFATSVSKEKAIGNSFDLSKFKNMPKELNEEVVEEPKEEAVEQPVEQPVEPVADAPDTTFDATALLQKQIELNRRK
jgi:ATP-dependent Clp protease protease subunit